MPLAYTVTEPLNLPAGAFNDDAIAVVHIQGGRYGGQWVINAYANDPNKTIGEIETYYDLDRHDMTKDGRYPALAVDSAFVWLHDEAKTRGWRLLAWDNLSDQYAPEEKPFFILARAVIGGEKFVPAAGVTYADEVSR